MKMQLHLVSVFNQKNNLRKTMEYMNSRSIFFSPFDLLIHTVVTLRS
jgi:hypothetical protein